jgi:hypothetical protein
LSFMATILRASSPARYAPSSAPGAPGTERVWVKPGGCSGTLSATGARTERCGSAALGFCPSFALGLVFRHTVSSSALRLARGTRRADRVPDQPVRGRRHRATIVSACEEGAGEPQPPEAHDADLADRWCTRLAEDSAWRSGHCPIAALGRPPSLTPFVLLYYRSDTVWTPAHPRRKSSRPDPIPLPR